MKVSHIKDLVTHRLAKHLTLVFIGNIFAAFLGFLAVLIVSKQLTVRDFGLFNISISVMLIASRLSGLGMDTVMIRFTSSYLGVEKTSEATQVLRATFLVRIIVSSIISVIIFNTAELIATKVFHYSSLTPLLKLTAFGVVAISILNYLKSAFYTYQLFQMGVILQILVDFGKLSIVLVLIFYLKMNTFAAVTAFVFAPRIGILLGFGLLWQKFFSKGKPIQNLFSQLFSYSKWLFVSNVCGITLPCVGIFMLVKMLSSESAGIYGLALNLT
jgi:O-antigen/teichoic acid export membrane protein